jgi:hypothetical protein
VCVQPEQVRLGEDGGSCSRMHFSDLRTHRTHTHASHSTDKTHLDGELFGELLHHLDGREDDVLPRDVAQEAQVRAGRDDVLGFFESGMGGWVGGWVAGAVFWMVGVGRGSADV